MALLSLLLATLFDDVMEYVIGCKTSCEAWNCLQERYASVSMVRVNQLKTKFHTIQKGSDSIDKYLLRLKAIRDQLVSTGERVTDNDVVIATLSGLPPDFDVVKTVILARDTPINLKDFRAQILSAEAIVESRITSLTTSMVVMYVQGDHSENSSGRHKGGDQGDNYSQ
nr:uncharacterized protein LOC103401273 [Malus domestica]